MRLSLILLCLQLWGNVNVCLAQNVTCSTPPVIAHASVTEETKRDEYSEGNVIHFTCDTGYISGPTIRYMCTSQGWVAISRAIKQQCYLKPCQLPDDTPNGYYQIIHGDDFVFGTTIKYFCKEGYQMVSKDATRTCLLDRWTNHVPVCDPLSCDPPPADEQVTVIGLLNDEDPILPDRFLQFSCGPEKILTGSSILICGKDGQWDNPFPTCEDIACKLDEMHHHLNVNGVPPANETMKIGHKLQFQCSEPYTLDGPAQIECLETGQWNARFPTCAEGCKVTGVPHSVRTRTYVPNNQLRKGQKLRFQCRQWGHFLRGNAEVECLSGGQWSHPFPTCGDPSGCEKPPGLADGDVEGRIKLRYSHGESVQYVCQNYYTITGRRSKSCFNGEWIGDQMLRCLKPCTVGEEIKRKHNIAFRHTYEEKLYAPHGDQMEFKCIQGKRHDRVFHMRQSCNDGVMNFPTCV